MMRCLIFVLLLPAVGVAGEFNKKLDLGDPAPGLEGLAGH